MEILRVLCGGCHTRLVDKIQIQASTVLVSEEKGGYCYHVISVVYIQSRVHPSQRLFEYKMISYRS